jgi:hypothetical protein
MILAYQVAFTKKERAHNQPVPKIHQNNGKKKKKGKKSLVAIARH